MLVGDQIGSKATQTYGKSLGLQCVPLAQPQSQCVYRVCIDLGFEETHLTLTFPKQAIRLTDLVPVARMLEDSITGAIIRQSELSGQPVSCTVCTTPSCCQHLVGLSTVEAAFMAELLLGRRDYAFLELMKDCHDRAQQLDHMVEGLWRQHSGASDCPTRFVNQLQQYYGGLEADCVFLVNNKCIIYRDRPLICRHWLAAGCPADCTSLGVVHEFTVPMPVSLNDVLIETASRCLNRYEIVVLPSLIDWYEDRRVDFQRLYRTEELAWTFLESLQHVARKDAYGRTPVRIDRIR